MIGNKMVDLANYLESKRIFNRCDFDFFMGNAQIKTFFENKGRDQHVVARVEYPAVYYIENFTQPTELIPALLSTWLVTHDCDRERLNLDEPTFLPTQADERNAKKVDIEFEVVFSEEVKITPDPDTGIIDYKGRRFKIAEHSAPDVATGVGRVEAME